eukprot:gnl/MRDRNA2_/MRDRNA2_97578_c0_seq1.p1 gnl/MRDRNA2_/MRDRNA2_97578_c0~~gnl/MRDRNA2_/MRDRNA2_97578_c0_seq1.p1  ORF type:complete len:732 (-),score=201.77 gnl/MRDRNA2_/MRDRNA2_97578_c0_seq1:89-2140(-)
MFGQKFEGESVFEQVPRDPAAALGLLGLPASASQPRFGGPPGAPLFRGPSVFDAAPPGVPVFKAPQDPASPRDDAQGAGLNPKFPNFAFGAGHPSPLLFGGAEGGGAPQMMQHVMEVQIHEGAKEGDMVNMLLPNGQMAELRVPANLPLDRKLTIQVPLASNIGFSPPVFGGGVAPGIPPVHNIRDDNIRDPFKSEVVHDMQRMRCKSTTVGEPFKPSMKSGDLSVEELRWQQTKEPEKRDQIYKDHLVEAKKRFEDFFKERKQLADVALRQPPAAASQPPALFGGRHGIAEGVREKHKFRIPEQIIPHLKDIVDRMPLPEEIFVELKEAAQDAQKDCEDAFMKAFKFQQKAQELQQLVDKAARRRFQQQLAANDLFRGPGHGIGQALGKGQGKGFPFIADRRLRPVSRASAIIKDLNKGDGTFPPMPLPMAAVEPLSNGLHAIFDAIKLKGRRTGKAHEQLEEAQDDTKKALTALLRKININGQAKGKPAPEVQQLQQELVTAFADVMQKVVLKGKSTAKAYENMMKNLIDKGQELGKPRDELREQEIQEEIAVAYSTMVSAAVDSKPKGKANAGKANGKRQNSGEDAPQAKQQKVKKTDNPSAASSAASGVDQEHGKDNGAEDGARSAAEDQGQDTSQDVVQQAPDNLKAQDADAPNTEHIGSSSSSGDAPAPATDKAQNS